VGATFLKFLAGNVGLVYVVLPVNYAFLHELCIEFAGMLADVNVQHDNLIHSLNLTSVCSQIYIS